MVISDFRKLLIIPCVFALILHRTNLGLAYCQITCYPTTGGNGYGNVQHQKKPNGGGTAELWFTASVAR